MLFISVFLYFISPIIQASETEYTLEPVVVKANSSFDSLNEDTYLPQKKVIFNSNRSGTLSSFEQTQVYPASDLGFPGGANGVNLGGRSLDDTQVSTLGVPLNLPQGGGPDLSIFPSYLWSGASISTVPSAAGFSPQGVSGSIQLDLWTRTQVRDLKFSTPVSRITVNYDRNLQNFSMASKTQNIAIIAGMNFGRQTGPAASLSYYFIKKPKSHFLFHLLGTQQDADSPGSKSFPSPNDKIKTWRVIPVLESHQEFGEERDLIIWESTYYGDLQQLRFEDPSPSNSTNDHIQEYGVENAIHWHESTLALSARLTNYQSSTFGNVNDWPIMAQLSHDFILSDQWKMKLAGGGTAVSSTGFSPTARASFKNELSSRASWFYELNSLAKMPTLTSRYYVSPFFHGNPSLSPERVNGLIAGYQDTIANIETTTTAKAEYRNQIQVSQNNTIQNAGNASLISANEDLTWRVIPELALRNSTLLTYSRVAQSAFTYPDLPYFSTLLGFTLLPTDSFKFSGNLRYQGQSTTSTGGVHADYLLLDSWLEYSPTDGTFFTLGCENITDSRAEVVVDFPLPGRIAYLNARVNF